MKFLIVPGTVLCIPFRHSRWLKSPALQFPTPHETPDPPQLELLLPSTNVPAPQIPSSLLKRVPLVSNRAVVMPELFEKRQVPLITWVVAPSIMVQVTDSPTATASSKRWASVLSLENCQSTVKSTFVPSRATSWIQLSCTMSLKSVDRKALDAGVNAPGPKLNSSATSSLSVTANKSAVASWGKAIPYKARPKAAATFCATR